jgi:phage terminase large subunit-like protein
MAAQVDDLLYGGAAGGGKTEWLIEYVARQMELYPGNRGLILRRVFPSLERTIIPRAKLKLARRAKWHALHKTFTFANGSVLELGSVQYADDVVDYQGAEYGVVAFEEITEFMQSQVEFLIGRLRSTVPGVRPHLVATTNPGGTGHRWVKRWWIKPDQDELEPGEDPPKPGERWRPRPTPDTPRPRSRAFISARLEDNPALMEADPDYVHRLAANSNRALRQALQHGDWDAIDAVEGALWTAADLDGGRVRPDRLREIGTIRRVIAVDPSDGQEDGDAYGVAHVAKGYDGVAYVVGSWAWQASPRKMAERTVALYYETGSDAIVVERNHGGKWLVEVFRQVDPTANVIEVWASDGKRTRAEPVAALFEYDAHAILPYRARVVGWLPALEEELTNTEFDAGAASPNRLDAMVWGVTAVAIGLREARRSDRRDERYRSRR